MERASLKGWPKTSDAAIALQNALRERVEHGDRYGPVSTVAGVDVGYLEQGTIAQAAVAVLRFPSLELIESMQATEPVRFPYVPGLLSFRETPVVIRALRKLRIQPDLILCDAQGYAHPRRFGLACHLGVLVDVPTIGVAKTRLIGRYAEVAPERGAMSPLMDGAERIGYVLRTRDRVSPVYVSVGHRVSLESAVRWALACAPYYRLPETTRWADRLASNR